MKKLLPLLVILAGCATEPMTVGEKPIEQPPFQHHQRLYPDSNPERYRDPGAKDSYPHLGNTNPHYQNAPSKF